MKKILVTGASGFIGSYLIKELVKNFKVRCLVRKNLKFQHTNIEIIKGSMHAKKILKDACKDINIIIHLAAQKYNNKNLLQMRKTNIEGTKNLLQFAKNTHFIYISTWLAAYPEKTGFYGQTKKDAEEEVKKRGKNFTILRLPHIYGPSKTSLIFTRYILPIYLFTRYKIKPIFKPIYVKDLCLTIEKITGDKKYFRKSYYVISSNKLTEII